MPSGRRWPYYHAEVMPPPNAETPVMVERKAALAAAAKMESPAEAKARAASGGAKPAHYNPTAPLADEAHGEGPVTSAKAIWD